MNNIAQGTSQMYSQGKRMEPSTLHHLNSACPIRLSPPSLQYFILCTILHYGFTLASTHTSLTKSVSDSALYISR